MKTTVHDVAARAGVSITTVSLVLNDRPSRISEETRKKVWDAARALGFAHRMNDTGKNGGVFGIILPDIRNMFFSGMCAAAEQQAREYGFGTMFTTSDDYAENDLSYIDLMCAKGVNGIMLVRAARTTQPEEERLKSKIVATGLPFVTVDRKLEIENTCSIMVEHRVGAYLAAKHLTGLGHTRIGCIAGPQTDVVSFNRVMGYKDALREAGIAYDESLVCIGDYRTSSGEEHLPYLLGKEVTAIFCFNDLMAIGVYRGCRRYGLKVPQDLSVVGFDDIPFCESLDVPLTTVRQPVEEIGATAISELFNLVRRQRPPKDVLFEPQLKVRASTARL
ncbi:MAG: LacI family DNA-binding transcriptional regulator [Oscillospiraceae bacterium]